MKPWKSDFYMTLFGRILRRSKLHTETVDLSTDNNKYNMKLDGDVRSGIYAFHVRNVIKKMER